MPFPCKDVIVRIIRDHGGEIDQETFLDEFGELVPVEDALRVREQGRKAKHGSPRIVGDDEILAAGRRRYAHSRLGSGIKHGWLLRERNGTRSTLRLASDDRPPRRVAEGGSATRAKAQVATLLPQAVTLVHGISRNRSLADACASLTVEEFSEWLSQAEDARRELHVLIETIRKEGI